MNENKMQENPIEVLGQIYEIANMLDSATLYCDDLDPNFIHTEIGNILSLVSELLESAKTTRQINNSGVSFWLKFCEPLPEVSEDELIPREWQINQEELEDGKR